MPTVYDGIGTWYYGKANLRQRSAVCGFCHREGTLSSFDTRLWAVVFFIPVFPLGRRRVIDKCPNCHRHRVATPQDWEKVKAEAIAEGLRNMAAAPNDPAPALDLHRAYLFFGLHAEADKLLASMSERFAGDAVMQLYIGAAFQVAGKPAEAAPHFQRALKLDPGMKAAQRALGIALIGQRKPEEAHELLRYMEQPGPEFEFPVLFLLAQAYRLAGRHKEALALLTLLLQRAPDAAKDAAFRTAVEDCEKALNVRPSCLPPRKWGKRLLRAGAAAVVVLFIAALAVNWYKTGHRAVHVVNGLDLPVTMQVVGGRSVQVFPNQRVALGVSEGAHHAIVTGAIQEEFDFYVSGGLADRYAGKIARVINPGGAALLARKQLVYGRGAGKPPDMLAFYYGRQYMELEGVDFAFEPLPKTVTLEGRVQVAYRVQVDLVNAPPPAVVYLLLSQNRPAEALDIAEWHLRLHPDDHQLLGLYPTLAQQLKAYARAREFLADNCKRRPVQVEWHRAYQILRRNREDAAAIIAEYDALLQADPGNSALLYLRGRLSDSGKEARGFYQRAIEKDAGNAYAWYALSHHAMAAADWQAAKDAAAKACAAAPDDEDFKQQLVLARFILGDYAALEKEARAELDGKRPLHAARALCQVLVAQERVDEAVKACEAFETAHGKDSPGAIVRVRGDMLYAAGRFAELQKLTAGTLPFGRHLLFAALVEQGKLAEAGKLPDPEPPEGPDAFEGVVLCVAWKHAGDADMSAAWRKKAAAGLLEGGQHLARFAALLKRDAPPAVDDVTDLTPSPRQGAILFAYLAQRFPERAADYLARARVLNVERQFPYHFLRRLTAPPPAK